MSDLSRLIGAPDAAARGSPTTATHRGSVGLSHQRQVAAIRILFAVLAITCDLAAIMLSAVGAGWLYHIIVYGQTTALPDYMLYGYILAALFITPTALRGEYSPGLYLSYSPHIRRVVTLWTVAMAMALALAFLSKTSADISRGSIVLFFAGGCVSLLLVRLMLVRIVQDQAAHGQLPGRRVFLVGFEDDLRRFYDRYRPWSLGLDIAASAVVRGEDSLRDDLALAAAAARVLRPDDIYILAPWTNGAVIDATIAAFQRVPASIYLGPGHLLERFGEMQIERLGPITSLRVVRRPLSAGEVLFKRAIDLTLASIAIVALSPLLVLVALAIKLDSPGPALFLQRRYGFNQEPFRIFKFRSMTTLDDGPVVLQATRGDRRITRVGRFLRRTNIDELPQLLNVLRGDMSLVGPRPHAMAHDQLFERDIANYARRHNVKPGITGWAQVNGYRGETDTRAKMLRRIEHDLYYIDNWSIWLDLRILLLTVFSAKSYRNAI